LTSIKKEIKFKYKANHLDSFKKKGDIMAKRRKKAKKKKKKAKKRRRRRR
jgi:hypothetical protein|tara:strand:+ start:513 stop:662 length:150 start_codon:yes stop_codon:yes gene_type:complete